MNRIGKMCHPSSMFTDRQGQYLAFIYAYTRIQGRPRPIIQRYFQVSPPTVHQMVLALEHADPKVTVPDNRIPATGEP
jgi:Mn-dependent DtxR family transcriptional regulator